MKRQLEQCKGCGYAGQHPYWKGDYRGRPLMYSQIEFVISRGCLKCLVGDLNHGKVFSLFDIGKPKGA